MNSLKNKAIRGVSWSAVDNIAGSGISFLVGIVLARILSPSEFGILGMIMVFIAVSNSIVDSGFSSALIQKNDAKDVDYNTVFYFNLLLGIILFIVLFLCAPAISLFFNEPVLIPVTRVMGTVLIINAFAIIQRTLLSKEVNFKTQTKVSLIASITSGVIGIGMAFAKFGIWSLVGQQISKQLLNSILLWIFNEWRPAKEFSIQSFKELFGFGSKLLLTGLIDTVYKNIYYLIIGKFYSADQLGQYTRAEQFNSIFSSNLTSVIQRVSYPVLCSIKSEEDRLKQVYKRIIKSSMLVTFALMLGLVAIAKPLILILIGEKWLPSIAYLQIICFGGMLYPLHVINLTLLLVKGRTDLNLRLEIIKKVIAIFPICLGILYGIEFMLWGSVFTAFVSYYLNSYYSAILIDYSIWEQIRDILPTFIVSFIVSFFMWSITFLNYSIWVTLPMQLLLGIVMLTVIYEIIKLSEYLEIKEIVFSLIKKQKDIRFQ